METLFQDLRYGIRLLVKRPAFTAIAIITLALGIGANTAIFSVVNAVLLRPLPYPAPERLVTLRFNQSLPDLDDIKSQSQMFEHFGGVVMQALDYTGEAEPVQVQAALCNRDLFQALGAQPVIGRIISEDEDRYGAAPVVLLSHQFWQQHFGGDANVEGKAITLSGNSYTIIGVMPAAFTMPRETPDIWAAVRVASPAAKFRGVHFLRTYFRLKPGVSINQAQAEFEAIDRWLEQQYPDDNKGRQTALVSLHERVVGNTRPALLVLFGAVGLVFLIACANFANLLLARAASRQQEIVIRAAMGANRARLIRQMLTESVMLAVLGGACGLVLAMWGIDLLVALKPANLPRLSAIGIDLRVLGFTFAVSILTGVIFGLVPAISSSKLNLNDALKEGGRSTSASASRQLVRNLLVVSEIALALILLIGAGLLIKGFMLLWRVDPGFSAENMMTMRIELPETRYREIEKQMQFRQQMLDELNEQAGVQAAMVSELPLSGDSLTHNFLIEGRAAIAVGEAPELETRTVSRDYFDTMKIPLMRGRAFTTSDRAGAPMVGMVNESFVRQYFPDQEVIGARIRWARGNPPVWMTIIGVVSDVKHFGLNQPEQPAYYGLYEQLEMPWKRWMYVVARGDQAMETLARRVKSQIWKIDNRIPVTKVQTMSEVIAASVAEQRFNMLLLGLFAAVAMLLAGVGIYGVMSYSVTQRTHEIGVRMALGASSTDVLRMILGHGALVILAGLGLGLAGAFALTRLMSSLLYGVTATDPTTYTIISVALVAVALAACYIPARRATRVDPMIALRYE
ncbi:MAG: ABC transporter permease [Blastocatellia bacterium]